MNRVDGLAPPPVKGPPPRLQRVSTASNRTAKAPCWPLIGSPRGSCGRALDADASWRVSHPTLNASAPGRDPRCGRHLGFVCGPGDVTPCLRSSATGASAAWAMRRRRRSASSRWTDLVPLWDGDPPRHPVRLTWLHYATEIQRVTRPASFGKSPTPAFPMKSC